MADVKFMDISENSNPATTDSILVANKDNGVKRTTLGTIGNMFAVKGLFHFENVTQPAPIGNRQKAQIEAPSVEGYKFVFWLNSSTVGFVEPNYIDNPTNSTAGIWVPTDTTPYKGYNFVVSAIAVYIKADLA